MSLGSLIFRRRAQDAAAQQDPEAEQRAADAGVMTEAQNLTNLAYKAEIASKERQGGGGLLGKLQRLRDSHHPDHPEGKEGGY